MSALAVLNAAAVVLTASGIVLGFQWLRRKAERFWQYAAFAASDVLFVFATIAERSLALPLIFAVLAVINAALAWFFWRRRKRRGRPAAIGHKARARIAAMTARMRERAARPAPAGAR